MGPQRPPRTSRYQTRPELVREQIERWLTSNEWLALTAFNAFEMGDLLHSLGQRGETNRRRLPDLDLDLWRACFGSVQGTFRQLTRDHGAATNAAFEIPLELQQVIGGHDGEA
jgi:hypothetical protein